MKLNNTLYAILKWSCMVAIPALAVAYHGLAGIWGFPFPEEISMTANIICTLIGALIGISTAEYYREIK